MIETKIFTVLDFCTAGPKQFIAHLRNRSTIGDAFLTTQFIDSCDLELPTNDACFYQWPSATLAPWRILIFLSGF
jgi:hypothetical protein